MSIALKTGQVIYSSGITAGLRQSAIPQRSLITSRILPAKQTGFYGFDVSIDERAIRQAIVSIEDAYGIAMPLIIARRRRYKKPHSVAFPIISPIDRSDPEIRICLPDVVDIRGIRKHHGRGWSFDRRQFDKRPRGRVDILRKNSKFIEIHPDAIKVR